MFSIDAGTPSLVLIFGIAGLLLAVNIFYAVATYINIRRWKKDSRVLSTEDSQRHCDTKKRYVTNYKKQYSFSPVSSPW